MNRPVIQRALICALVDARKAAGMTQRELSRRLGRAGTYIWKIETSRRPRLLVLEFLAITDALGVNAARLMARIEKASS